MQSYLQHCCESRCSLQSYLQHCCENRCNLQSYLQHCCEGRCNLQSYLQHCCEGRCSLQSYLQHCCENRCSLHEIKNTSPPYYRVKPIFLQVSTTCLARHVSAGSGIRAAPISPYTGFKPGVGMAFRSLIPALKCRAKHVFPHTYRMRGIYQPQVLTTLCLARHFSAGSGIRAAPISPYTGFKPGVGMVF